MTLEPVLRELFREQEVPAGLLDHAALVWWSAPHLWAAIADERWWDEMERDNRPDLYRDGAPTG